jgi:hypothetical protein
MRAIMIVTLTTATMLLLMMMITSSGILDIYLKGYQLEAMSSVGQNNNLSGWD